MTGPATSSGVLQHGTVHARRPSAAAELADLLPGEPLLEVEDLQVRFTRSGRRINAVNGLSYQLHPGRMMAIIGESGSGKSVSSRALMGLLPTTAQVSGSAVFSGRQLIG